MITYTRNARIEWGDCDAAGIVFMFAPTMHPAMRHVGPVRRELGIETVMNMVGPLANPGGAQQGPGEIPFGGLI